MSGAVVTVVVPTYNRSGLLARAIRSVLDQTLVDFELYVADNGSTDDTADVVAGLDDPRVHWAPNPANLGPYANFTRSLYLGSAPYLALLQDDDLMLPKNLERKVALLEEHPAMVMAHAAFQYVDADDRVIKEHANWARLRTDTIETGAEFIARSFAGGCRANFSSVVFRRSLVIGEQFDPADRRQTEMALYLRLARRGDVGFLDDALVAVRRHEDSTTVREGAMSLAAGGYVNDFEGLRGIALVKRRFLADYGDELGHRARAERDARTWMHRQLALLVLARTEPARHLGATLRSLRAATQVDASFARSGEAARLVAGAVAGERLRARFGRSRRSRGAHEGP